MAAGQPPVVLSKGSAYLYVEGTFYNDLRSPEAQDYSEPIRAFNRCLCRCRRPCSPLLGSTILCGDAPYYTSAY